MRRVWSTGIYVALSVLAAAASKAQKPRTATLVATVAIDGSRELLPDAEVAITDLSRTTKSDIVGEAAISNVPPGQHTVRVLKVIFLANGEHVLGSTRSSCDADMTRMGLPAPPSSRTVANCSPTKPCPVPVILDGQDLHDAVGDALHLRDLAAAEFYTATQVPTQYRVSGYGCGVLVLWSRRP